MKKILLLLTLGVVFSFTPKNETGKINWMTLEEAVEAQKENPKKIMIDAYTVWCGPCKMLDKNTFQNADVANYINEHYYAVKFNAEGNDTVMFNGQTFTNPNYNPVKSTSRNSQHQLASYFGVNAYPTILFLDEEGNFITPLPGYRSPQQLEVFLKLFKSDGHKTITTQEQFNEYLSSFKYEFKE